MQVQTQGEDDFQHVDEHVERETDSKEMKTSPQVDISMEEITQLTGQILTQAEKWGQQINEGVQAIKSTNLAPYLQEDIQKLFEKRSSQRQKYLGDVITSLKKHLKEQERLCRTGNGSVRFAVGDRVSVPWGLRNYVGSVKSINDGQPDNLIFTIHYDDGEERSYPESELVKKAILVV